MEHRKERFEKICMLCQKCGISLHENDIHYLLEALDKLPDTRNRKTAEIKEAIDSGKYQVSAEKVSTAMLNSLEFEYLENQHVSLNFLPHLLEKIPSGKEHCDIFHKLGSICVSDIFHDDLSSPLWEKRGSKGHKRYDLMLYNRATNGFWLDMKKMHRIFHIIFEFKNWKKNDHRKFSKQISDYSERNRAVVLVTRDEPNENLFFESSQLYNKIDNFLPLPISINDLNMASFIKSEGSSPSEIFEGPYLKLQAA